MSAQTTEARIVRGFRDVEAAEIRRHDAMIATIREVYERYGFEPLETPAFEYTDALGKFLPDQDRPGAGVWVGEAGAGNNFFVDAKRNKAMLGLRRDF